MMRHLIIAVGAVALIGTTILPDDAIARGGRGGGAGFRGGAVHARGGAVGVRGGAVGYRGGAAGYRGAVAGRGYGYRYGRGAAIGAAAVGAAAVGAGAYYGGGYNNCYRNSYGQLICPNQYNPY
jgi:hypothetical protein